MIANLIVAGGQVAMKAVANAYSKALANAQRSGVAQEAAAKGAAAGGMFRKKVMQVEEARQVLGVEKGATLERVLERHDKLMTANEKDPETGQYRGSFYLQSMINNAKESVLREDFPDYKPPGSGDAEALRAPRRRRRHGRRGRAAAARGVVRCEKRRCRCQPHGDVQSGGQSERAYHTERGVGLIGTRCLRTIIDGRGSPGRGTSVKGHVTISSMLAGPLDVAA